MPLINSKSDLIAAKIVELVRNTRAYYCAAASQLNDITALITGLDSENLASFGNNLGPVEMERLSITYIEQAKTLNDLIHVLNDILLESGIPTYEKSFDFRPLAEKLAEQGREIVLSDDGVFSIRIIENQSMLRESPPFPTTLGQEWTSPTGTLYRVAQATGEDGQFLPDDPGTPPRESLRWVVVEP